MNFESSSAQCDELDSSDTQSDIDHIVQWYKMKFSSI